jgi:hypothetical protein
MDGPVWPGPLLWRQSPWDHFVHGFTELGEVSSEAICRHCAPTSRLAEPLPEAKPCLACQLMHGRDLAEQRGDDAWR